MAKADVMAGRAYVSIYTKNDKLTRGLKSAQQQVQKFGADMLSLGTKMAAMTAALVTPIVFATAKFAEFDDAMRMVGAVSQSTGDQLALMTARAKDLGATTSFTAVQVAQLMTELGRAGFNPDQINVMTEAVMNLARATGTDATLASGIMASSIRQFGLEAMDAARVADVLTVAANSTFNTVEGLGESLKYAGPVAKSLGMSLEDTVAILGSLGNVGIQGSEAGTALRRLGVITAATGKELKDTFGISNVDAAGNLKPLIQIMDEIGAAVKRLPVTEQVEKMNTAFGLLGITSAQVLAGAANNTTDLAAKLRTAEGAAARAAKEMDAGIGGAFRIIMSAVEGLQIAIGEALSGSIKGVTEALTTLIGRASEWITNNKDMTVAIAATVAGLGAASAAILGIGIAAKIAGIGIGIAVAGITAIKTVSKLAIGGFNLFVAATTGLATVLQGLFATSLVASTAATTTLAASQAAASVVVTTYAGLLGAAASSTALLGITSGLTTSALIAQSGAMITASAASSGMILASGGASAGMLSLSGSSVVAAAGLGTFTAAGGVMATAWTGIAGVMSAAWAVIMGPITPFVIAAGAIVAVMTAIGSAAAWAAIKGTDFSAAWTLAKNTLSELLVVAKRVGGILMDALAGGDYDLAFRAMIAGLKIALADGIAGMQGLWRMFWGGMWNVTKRFWTSFLGLMVDVVTTTAKAIANPLDAAKDVAGMMGKIGNAVFKLDIGIDTEMIKAKANAELDKIEKELEERKKKRKDAADMSARDAEYDAAYEGWDPDGEGAGSAPSVDIAKMDAEIAALEAQLGMIVNDAGNIDRRLQAEMDALQAQGLGQSDSDGVSFGVDRQSKASVASFSLAELASSAGQGVAQKQLSETKEMKKFLKEQVELGWQQLAAIQNGGPHFP